MTVHKWPADTLARAEKAVADLEAFWDRFRSSATQGRKLELSNLHQIRRELAAITEADGYTMESLAKLDDVCRRLTRSRQPENFDEQQVLVYGLGDVWNLRSWMARLGLVKDELRPLQPH